METSINFYLNLFNFYDQILSLLFYSIISIILLLYNLASVFISIKSFLISQMSSDIHFVSCYHFLFFAYIFSITSLKSLNYMFWFFICYSIDSIIGFISALKFSISSELMFLPFLFIENLLLLYRSVLLLIAIIGSPSF